MLDLARAFCKGLLQILVGSAVSLGIQQLLLSFHPACKAVQRAQHFILLQDCNRLSRSRLSSGRRIRRGCRQSVSGSQAAPGSLVAAPVRLSCCLAVCQQGSVLLLPLQRLHWVSSLQAVLLGSRVRQSHLCLLLASLVASASARGRSKGAKPLARQLTPCSTLRCLLRSLCRLQRWDGRPPGARTAVAAAAAASPSASTCAAASAGALLPVCLQLAPPPAVAVQRAFKQAACLLAASTRALLPRRAPLWPQPPAAWTPGR